MYTNADCLTNKRAELQALIDIHKPAIIGVVEVKPKRCKFRVQRCEVKIPGFELFENLEKPGRGICLHVREELRPSAVELPVDFEEAELAECKIDGKQLMIGLVYRSPGSNNDNNRKLNELLSAISEKKTHQLLLLGDFNYPDIDWETNICGASDNHPSSSFLSTVNDAFLIQHQREHTRFRDGQRPTMDDLVLTNRDDLVNEIITAPAIGKSDHATLVINLAGSLEGAPGKERHNYRKGNYTEMRKYFQETNWDAELGGRNMEEAWSLFRQRIDEATDKFVPKTRSGGSRRKTWMDKGTLTTVRKKHQLFRRWIETKDGEHYRDYIKARNKATKSCRKAKKKMEATVAAQARSNPKSFWSFIKTKTQTRSGIADLKKDDGTRATTDEEKADTLNDFFRSVFTKEEEGDLPEPPHYSYSSQIDDFDITEAEVKKLLLGLKAGKAPGPDCIPPLLLTENAEALALPLAILFRKSLREGRIPDDWRKANVIPIFKKGSRLNANNYRPVSLTCIICKVMETLIRNQLITHLLQNNLICREQHGFVPGRSCTTQLLDSLDTWTQILDAGGAVDVIYMDFRKAFDSVPHRRLIAKTEAHGVKGKVLKWIQDFLHQRTQLVSVNTAKSREAGVASGIPQGSVLGPILFVLYINDLPRQAESHVRMFADDTKLFSESNDADALQRDLDSLQRWSSDWLLQFHPEKCSVLRLGNAKCSTEYFMKGRSTDGEPCDIALAESLIEKDLGVYVDNKLSFKHHVSQATAKANKVLGIIRRSFDHLSRETFIQLYKALVRPILEYGHSVWNPHLKTLCQDIEAVQKRATGLIGDLKGKEYPDRLAALKLPSLEHRRLRGDMLDTYKYMHGIYDTDRPNLELYLRRDTRGHSLKLAKQQYRLNIRGGFFSERVVGVWNDLPDAVVTAPTVNTFKNRLDNHWANLPSMYDPECLH